MVYSLDLSLPGHSYWWVVCVLNSDPASLISCLLSGCTHDPSVWGDCAALCIHWDLVWAALSFPLSQRMFYCHSIDAFSKRGRLTVWVCSSAYYVGILLVALVMEASVSLCIHKLGTSSHASVLQKFPFTLFFFPIIIISFFFLFVFLPTRLVWIKHFFFPRDHQYTFVYWSSLLEEDHYLTMQYIRSICQQQIKL